MSERIWTCKIGGDVGDLPPGSDFPMRQAVERAYYELTGKQSEFNFSGWGGALDEGERACVENRLPDTTVVVAECRKAIDDALDTMSGAESFASSEDHA